MLTIQRHETLMAGVLSLTLIRDSDDNLRVVIDEWMLYRSQPVPKAKETGKTGSTQSGQAQFHPALSPASISTSSHQKHLGRLTSCTLP